MMDRMKLRREQQELLRTISEESGMKPSAIAKEIGVRPSTLNKVAAEGDKHTHVLSTPTLELLAEFRARRGLAPIKPKIDGNLSEEAEGQQLLRIWFTLDRGVRNAALTLIEAASRSPGEETP